MMETTGILLILTFVIIAGLCIASLVIGVMAYNNSKDTLAVNGDGSQLTNLNASNITTGTLDAERLPENVVLTDVEQSFTAQHGFAETELKAAEGKLVWDVATNQVSRVSLSSVTTMAFPTNVIDGFAYVLTVTISGSGSLSFTGTQYRFANGITTVSATSVVQLFASDGFLNVIISAVA